VPGALQRLLELRYRHLVLPREIAQFPALEVGEDIVPPGLLLDCDGQGSTSGPEG
jgi:hypothetical protein